MKKLIFLALVVSLYVSCSKCDDSRPEIKNDLSSTTAKPTDWTLYYIKEELMPGMWGVTAIAYDKEYLKHAGGFKLTTEPFTMADFNCWIQYDGKGAWVLALDANGEKLCSWWDATDPSMVPVAPKM